MVTRLAVPARTDPVRIVPLHLPDALGVAGAVAPIGPATQLTYHGGHLLPAVEVSTIFWGRTWSAGRMKVLAGQLNAFLDAILDGPLIQQLGEYSATGQTIGPGRRVGTATVSQPALPASISDGAIQHFVQSQIASNPLVPQPTPNSLYFIYLRPGVSVAQGGARSCQAFCGYHNDIAGQVFYAVMPYPGCSGCTGGLNPLDALTATSSHELCEAITDPVPGQGWYDDRDNAEIGDLCAWRTKQLAGSTVQLEWSNRAGGCV